MNLKDKILAAQDLKSEAVECPEWDVVVHVRVMTGSQRDAYEFSLSTRQKLGQLGDNFRADLLAKTLCDENGQLLFSAEDVAALGEKNAIVLDRLVRVARRLNKLEDDGEAAAKN